MQTSITEPVSASHNLPPPPSPHRIRHIDGLRGIAIILVLLFHLSKDFPNGYYGVDIFLVISGYMLFRNFWKRDDGFSLFSYVGRKVSRLWPSTICITLPCVVIAMFLLPDGADYETFDGGIATLLGGANLFYDYNSDGYFAAIDAIGHPLVHTWYLSLIAQIYLIAGVLYWLCKSLSNKAKLIVFLVCIICSCAICYLPSLWSLVTPLHENFSTYYWTSGRLWIVLAGGLVPLMPELAAARMTRSVLAGAALAGLLVIALLLPKCPCPGLVEVLAIIGSMLCLKYGTCGIGTAVLENRLVLAVGKYSFSLYLVHWPVLVFFATYSLTWEDSICLKLAAIVCSFLCAYIFYHTVEKHRFPTTWIFVAWIASLAFMYSITANYHRIKYHFHIEKDNVLSKTYNETPRLIQKECNSGKLYQTLPDFRRANYKGGVMNSLFSLENVPLLYSIGETDQEANFLLLGDSHAGVLTGVLDRLARKHHWHGAFLNSYVVPIENYFYGGVYCQRWDREKADLLLSYLRENPQIDTVILSIHWANKVPSQSYYDWDGVFVNAVENPQAFFKGIRDYFVRIRDCGVKILVFSDVPRFYKISTPLSYISRHAMLNAPLDEELFICTKDEYDAHNKAVNDCLARMEEEGICKVVHLEKFFFKDGPARLYKDGIFYFSDTHHMTPVGAVKALEEVEEELGAALDNPGQPAKSE